MMPKTGDHMMIPSTDVIQLTLTLKMTTAQVLETSVTVNNNTLIQDYVHPDDHTQPTLVNVRYVIGISLSWRGHWHGEVAVKIIEIENPTEEQLSAFRYQVGTFRKTRHENVVLFMGACMDPPKLAIITR